MKSETKKPVTTTHLLDELSRLDVRLWVEGGRLRYSAPPGVLTQALLAEMATHKPELIALVGATSGGGGKPQAPILAPVPRQAGMPLSFAQQRLWFLDRLAQVPYNIALAWRLDGPLDTGSLEKALFELVHRHEVLRTTFAPGEPHPIQIIAQGMPLALDAEDWSAMAQEAREARVRTEAAAERLRGFDLERGPLVRARLIRLAEQEHLFLLTLHHIIADGWSLGVAGRELSQWYNASVAGRSSPLPALPLQYADYAQWQRQWLQGAVLEEQLSYWRERLRGVPPVLTLPLDRPRPAIERHRGGLRPVRLSKELSDALRALSLRHGASLFMTLLAGFKALLARYSGEEDIVVGTPIANRGRVELEGLIGFFVNTLVLRTETSGDPSFVELLKRVRETALGAYAHQDLPFDRLVEALQPERTLSHHPLFQVLFVLQNAPAVELQLTDVRSRVVDVDHATAKFDLLLQLEDGAGGIAGVLEYNQDLFDVETLDRLARHYERLLAGAVAAPERPLSRVPLLSGAETEQLMKTWHGTASPYPRDQAIHTVFEAQASARAESVALRAQGQSMTYGELNRRANQLAWRLKEAGVGPDVPVGLCLERSLDMVVATLAVLKAGGAYVPLDPAYPAERLKWLVADTQTPVVLTRSDVGAALPRDGIQMLNLDREWPEISRRSTDNPPCVGNGENLAYVMYTSGSTGTPKGVAIPHRAVLRLVLGVDYVPLGPDTTVLHHSPASFDASTFELWAPLLHGGRCVLYPGRVPAIEDLGLLLRAEGVNVLWLTSALFNWLIEEDASVLSPVRHLLVGGEALSVSHVRRALARLPGTQLINGYGPTESTTFACCYAIPKEPPESWTSIPLGGPIANTQICVLDRWMEPVAPGLVGELHIGGDGLARGYWNRPELTAERFVAHPWEPGARLYKTGDLARQRADGTLEFLGRNDDQVKLRGYRIELGEIETVLGRQPGVNACAVVAREDGRGGKQLVAYVVAEEGTPTKASDFKRLLEGELPEYMVPSAFVFLERLPLTANGKVDRRALPAPAAERRQDGPYAAPQSELEERIARIWAEALRVDRVGRQDNFFDLGGHSLLLLQVHRRLQQALERRLAVVELFQYPTVEALARHLSKNGSAEVASRTPSPGRARSIEDEGMAVIGMAGRFPGAPTLEQFWENLCGGVESISFFSAEELEASGMDRALVRRPDYVRAKGALEGAELFDAAFFGYSPREAEVIDPQQRVFLECAWEALERAGYDPHRCQERIGLYAGVGYSGYWEQLKANPQLLANSGGYQLLTSNDKDFLPTRVSYKLNLRGPSVTVQTACSTSLVAVHLACQCLRQGEADIALAGGVTISLPLKSGYLFVEEGIASPDGHCRAFDEQAQGTVGGNGVGIVVLKPLSRARADGDTIYAVIKGSAINNDGSGKVGYTAPGVTGQAEVIRAAHEQSGIKPGTISYIETHGTGTALGDPIEIEALTQAFRAGGVTRTGFCAIGALKSNVGHLDAAAGVAGLIKAVLALAHRRIPPSLHFEKPNPRIDFAGSPFYVNTQCQEWPRDGHPRRAGVSSFGIGGTNAHVIVEEAPESPAPAPEQAQSRSCQILPLSARSPEALDQATRNLRLHLEAHPDHALADIAYTLQVGRKAFAQRRTIVCRDREGALAALGRSEDWGRAHAESSPRPVVFLFSGQGSQYVDMGRDLYETEPVYREAVDHCCRWLEPMLGLDLVKVLYPAVPGDADADALNQTALTQPALFVVEWALTRLWASWGVQPEAMIGHSIGEYVAATVAGVFELQDALKVVSARGRLMQRLPPGAMTAVPLAIRQTEAALGETGEAGALSVATLNAPALTVVSGPLKAVVRFEEAMERRGVACRRLRTSRAFHSAMMEPMLDSFLAELRSVRMAAPTKPFISNVTGEWIQASEATNPEYWVRHLRQAVQFSTGVQTLLKNDQRVFLEVGPGRTLSQLVQQHAAPGTRLPVHTSIRHPQETTDDQEHLLRTLGQLWMTGVSVDWTGFSAEERHQRVALPTYPFERQRYWVERSPQAGIQTPSALVPSKNPDLGQWVHVPVWKSAPLPVSLYPDDGSCCLIFSDAAGLSGRVRERLEKAGNEVVSVKKGEHFRQTGSNTYELDPRRPEEFERLLTELKQSERNPSLIVHAWSVAPDVSAPLALEDLGNALDAGFYSLLFLVQALGRQNLSRRIQIKVLTNHMQEVTDDAVLRPEMATVLGLVRVIPREFPYIQCSSIDVAFPPSQRGEAERLADDLASELLSPASEGVVAYRGRHRWVQAFESFPVKAQAALSPLRERGVYLITGGLGGLGLELAEELARSVRARLILVGRTALPAEADWPAWLETHDAADPVSRKLRKLQALRTLGAECHLAAADVSDLDQMRDVLRAARARFGRIHGVIHAAGIAGGGIIELKTRETAQAILKPKVWGTLVLDALLREEPVDFLVLCSSLASCLGSAGQVDYCAANAFLDAYAHTHPDCAARTVSINWDTWQEVGMAVAAELPGQWSEYKAERLRLGMLPGEGVEVFRRILSQNVAQALVSTFDLGPRMARPGLAERATEPEGPTETAPSSAAHPRPATGTPYAAPQTETEKFIANLWQDLLGFDKVGIHDSFFELGGHSLLGTQMLARLRDRFEVDLALRDFLEAATPAALARVIDNLRWALEPSMQEGEALEAEREEIRL